MESRKDLEKGLVTQETQLPTGDSPIEGEEPVAVAPTGLEPAEDEDPSAIAYIGLDGIDLDREDNMLG
ncbi:hypothetical protein FGG08_007336, partial [Glutinoglossum americanum]